MKGIVGTSAGKWELRSDLPISEPGPGQVRIRVNRAGICGTDVHIVAGDPSLASIMRFPVILGHEFCGHIDALGGGVSEFTEGQFVTAEMHEVCKACRACTEEDFHACQQTEIHGVQIDGAFAEYVVVSAWNVIALPEQIPTKVAAVMDALGNAVHTANCHEVSGREVALIGYGPIGAMAAEVLLFEGITKLYIVDIAEKAIERAKAWVSTRGVSDKVEVFDGGKPNTEPEIIAASSGGVDVALEFSGAEAGINAALRVTRAAGKVALLGMPKEKQVCIRNYSEDVIWKGLQMNAIIGRRLFETWDAMIALLTQGLDVSTIISREYTLEEFGQAVADFRDGKESKVVLRISS